MQNANTESADGKQSGACVSTDFSVSNPSFAPNPTFHTDNCSVNRTQMTQIETDERR